MLLSDSPLSLEESDFWVVAKNLLRRISAEPLELESEARLLAARSRPEAGRRIWNQGQQSRSGVREPEAGYGI